MVLVHLRQNKFPKGTYRKLKVRMKKISSNAYMIDLPPGLQISPIFKVANLYSFEGFDGEGDAAEPQADVLPRLQLDVIEDVLDVIEVKSRRGNPYWNLVKWLGKTCQ